MTTRELRAKYGDFTKTDYYTYPAHFFSPWDDFTMHIPNWKAFLARFEDQSDCKFLELGTAQGRSAVWMLENILTHPTSILDAVDIDHTTWLSQSRLKGKLDGQEFYLDCLQNLEPYTASGKCRFNLQTTQNFFRKLCADNLNGTYDFVYIDASHEPDDVLRDAICSYDALKQNGLMLFDDYGWKDCPRGIDAFLHAFNSKTKVLHKAYQVLVEKL